ncbi:MAG: 4Fe-4S double cluster binding domain-containing protein [Methanomassiliicoccus sp.]|nr:4Fe-4S double cluster binding domain-containing protein [Methanomassiliicoccus sp.]
MQPQESIICLPVDAPIMELHEKMPRLVRRLGGDLYGVADLSLARDEMLRQGGIDADDYPRAVVVGIRLMDSIVDQLREGRETRAVAVTYQTECYEYVNRRLNDIASRLASTLQSAGYKALPVPASERIDDERVCAMFSHKLAAHLAGLGWIGRSCLLITPQFGPRVRWVSVLTDAPLPAGTPLSEACGFCRACVDACPAKAIKGLAFREVEPREARYDALACQSYLHELENRKERGACGMCIAMCPHGRKRSV